MNVIIAGVPFKAQPYQMPAKGNAPEGWFITVDGEPTECRMTGGGKFPRYTYFTHNGKSYYLPKNITLDAGGNVEVVADAVAEAPEVKTPKAAKTPKVTDPSPVVSIDPAEEVARAKAATAKRSRKAGAK